MLDDLTDLCYTFKVCGFFIKFTVNSIIFIKIINGGQQNEYYFNK